ncbi:hypothetical protein CIPAW_05G087100 [Carya illinoinensis]|uniref:Uncharacterized protein n=1 Tax=Carya illinoinensis TaxID=32201 RepID=A0A8T1QGC2_CARIL|nr:hypothetical protein CIPAW_05G087100 [Carya illinoinensis]
MILYRTVGAVASDRERDNGWIGRGSLTARCLVGDSLFDNPTHYARSIALADLERVGTENIRSIGGALWFAPFAALLLLLLLHERERETMVRRRDYSTNGCCILYSRSVSLKSTL